MSSADLKLAQNIDLERGADAARASVESFYARLGNLSDLQQESRRTALSRIDVGLKESLIEIDPKEWGQSISYRSSDPVAQVAYGFCRIGGLVSFLSADRGEQGEFLHTYVTLTGHSYDRITDLYLDAQKVEFSNAVDGSGRRVFGFSQGTWATNIVFLSATSRGAEDQAANSDLLSQSNLLFPGKWTSAHRQQGQGGTYLIIFYTSDKFLNGPPEIAAEGRWKNDIWDPRSNTYGWTNNAILCWFDYLTNNYHGPKIPTSRFDLDVIKSQADICDQLVTLKDGSTEKRYTINGAFQASKANDHRQISDAMKQACAGELVRVGAGKIKLYAGAWRAPVVTLSERHLRSGLRIRSKRASKDSFNAIKGKYRSAETLWELSDYPPTVNSHYEEEDNGRRLFKEKDLPFTTSAATAQRINKIDLELERQSQEIEADFSLAAFQCLPGDVISFAYERLGLTKYYKIKSLDLVRKDNGGPVLETKLLLREIAASCYDWNNGEETTVDLAPNTTLPNPSLLLTPKGIDIGLGVIALKMSSGTDTLYQRSDGTIFTRLKLEWSPSVDPFVLSGGFHEIQTKLSDSTEWTHAGIVLGTISSFWILDVKDGELYDARVRTVTTSGKSEWLTRNGYRVIGKLENPRTPSGFRYVPTKRGNELTWDSFREIDFKYWEIRIGTTWGLGTPIYQGDQNSFVWEGKAAGTYNLWLRSRDRSDNYSDDSANLQVVITAPGAVVNLQGQAILNMVRLNWSAPSISSYPVSLYRIYKGATFAGSELLGEVAATIKAIQEQLSGSYRYWVEPVDVHGNAGTPSSIPLEVSSPPAFKLLYDQVLDPSLALQLTNAVIENDAIIAPVLTSQSYQNHFTGPGWSTPQDQIDAGYPIFIQPSNTDESIYEQVIDYGELLSAALIVVQDYPVWVSGTGTITKTISYSATIGGWIDTIGVNQVYAQGFRYLKIKYKIEGADDKAVLRLPRPRVRLEVTQEPDSGIIAVSSSDLTGTPVIYNKDFSDILEDSISREYVGSNPYFAAHTISGNDLRIFLWDTSGNRVSGNVRWGVQGILTG